MAERSERPEPDFGEDPRRGEMSDTGYPESQPEAVSGDTDYPAQGPEPAGAARDADETDAPSTSSGDESDPDKATGNPRAAGG